MVILFIFLNSIPTGFGKFSKHLIIQACCYQVYSKSLRSFRSRLFQKQTELFFLTLLMSFSFSVSVFLSTLAKPEFRLETLVGSCTAWSMEFSLMAKCRPTRLSAEETIPSTRFLARLERENTFLAPCSLTWNQQLSVRKAEDTSLFIIQLLNLIFLKKIQNLSKLGVAHRRICLSFSSQTINNELLPSTKAY